MPIFACRIEGPHALDGAGAAAKHVGMDAFDGHVLDPIDSPPLAADEIHVWSLNLPATLAPREIAAAAQRALGSLLRQYAQLAEVPTLERGAHGKPFAPSLPGLEFNLSHAGPHVLLAFARDQAIGVDIERLDRHVSVDDLARRFFAPDEAAALERLPAPLRIDTFLQLWTRKEAVLKALGEGIGFGLHRLAFAIGGDGEVGALRTIAREAGEAGAWRLHRLPSVPGTAATLAWRGPMRTVRRLELRISAPDVQR